MPWSNAGLQLSCMASCGRRKKGTGLPDGASVYLQRLFRGLPTFSDSGSQIVAPLWLNALILGRIHRKQAEGKQERLHPTDSRARRWRPLQPLQQGTTFEIRSCKVHGSELGILTSALGLPKLSSEFPAPPNCKAARYNPFIRDPTPV